MKLSDLRYYGRKWFNNLKKGDIITSDDGVYTYLICEDSTPEHESIGIYLLECEYKDEEIKTLLNESYTNLYFDEFINEFREQIKGKY